jgi:hypothetical protein
MNNPIRLTRSVRCARTAADHVMAEPSNDFDEITGAHFSPNAQGEADIGLLTSGICDGRNGFQRPFAQ